MGYHKNIINKNQKPQTQSRFKIGDNLITSDKNIMCNKFNDFFVNIGPTLAKSIPQVDKSPLSYIGNRLTESIYLEPVTEKEINTLISALKDTATGFDDMDSMSLKISSVILVKFFQRFLKKICIIEFQPSLKYLRNYMKINMNFEKI